MIKLLDEVIQERCDFGNFQ